MERLQAEKLKREIAFRLDGGGEFVQVVAGKVRIEQFGPDAGFHIERKVIGIAGRLVGLRSADGCGMHERQDFSTQLVEQQPRADIGVVRLLLHQRTRRHDAGERQFVLTDAIIEVAVGLGQNRRRIDTVEACAGFLNDQGHASMVERSARSVGKCDPQRRLCGRLCCFGNLRLDALLGPFLPIQHIGARDLVMFAAHQRQFDLVLHILDVKRTALAYPSGQRANDISGEFFN
jgi:hypothetical protein